MVKANQNPLAQQSRNQKEFNHEENEARAFGTGTFPSWTDCAK